GRDRWLVSNHRDRQRPTPWERPERPDPAKTTRRTDRGSTVLKEHLGCRAQNRHGHGPANGTPPGVLRPPGLHRCVRLPTLEVPALLSHTSLGLAPGSEAEP